jgi:hypothetical protein
MGYIIRTSYNVNITSANHACTPLLTTTGVFGSFFTATAAAVDRRLTCVCAGELSVVLLENINVTAEIYH